jgi:two-component system LytT family response regulator
VDILLLEDEEYTRRFLKKLVMEHPLVDNVIDTPSGKEAVRLAKEAKPDIALLDIELTPEENVNGIEVAKLIGIFSPETHFVFITGYSKYAIESFAVHPYDYLLKPINKSKVLETIGNLAGKSESKTVNKRNINRIPVKVNNEIFLINSTDILFVEKLEKRTLIHTVSNVYKISQTLNELENKLEDSFLRVHKSFIVNLDKISKIKEVSSRSYEISFENSKKVALMSRYKFEEYKDRFMPS